MTQVFISYSRADRDFVTHLIADLQKGGIDVWIDRQGLRPGMPNWEHALREAIHASDAVLLVASPHSFQSQYVQGELSIAKDSGRPIYPVWAVGERWSDCVPMDLIKTQYVDMRADHYSAGVVEIVAALNGAGIASVQDVLKQEAPPLPPDFVPRNPYKGLRPFRQDDRGDFFGREALVKELLAALEQAGTKNERLLAVVGPSGSGKSSVVMAGLL